MTASRRVTLKSSREAIDRNPRLRNWFSPVTLSLHRKLAPLLRQRATGAFLDAGCGAMPYRPLVESAVSSYDGLDIAPRSDDTTYVCSLTDMADVPSDTYDTILCSEVLEHVDDPRAAAQELSRVLRSEGVVIISVPFLSRLHEEPHDFQRFTEHGLRLLIAQAGLDLESIETTGTVFSFLGHQLSSAIVLTTWRFPIIRWIAFGVNAIFVVLPSMTLDAIFSRLARKAPLGYVAVATRSLTN